MSTAILELPADMPLQDGETFSWQIEGVALGGKLVVKKLSQQGIEAAVKSPADRQKAVDAYLDKWSGALSGMTDQEVEDARWEYLKEKHLK
jgi:hypothetical protein